MTVRITDASFRYARGGFALRIPELHVETGQRLAVIGPSGSGKTTFLNLIAGITRPAQGQIEIGQVDVTALGERARRDFRITKIGFVFQDFELIEYLSVRDNILHPFRISSALRLSREVHSRLHGLVTELDIGDKLDRYVSELSQGEKQRAAICRALLPQPALILADEATGNLDPINKARIMALLHDRCQRQGATLIAVTHDHDLLPDFDRVVDFSSFGIAAP